MIRTGDLVRKRLKNRSYYFWTLAGANFDDADVIMLVTRIYKANAGGRSDNDRLVLLHPNLGWGEMWRGDVTAADDR